MAKGRKRCSKQARHNKGNRSPKAIGDDDIVGSGSDAAKLFSIHVGERRFRTLIPLSATVCDLVAEIEKDLCYVKDDACITFVQLASNEQDSEPEDLDFNLILADLIVRMKGHHLVAVAKPNNSASPAAALSTIASEESPIAKATHASDFSISSGVQHGAPRALTNTVAPDENATFRLCGKPSESKSNLPAPKVVSSRAEAHASQIQSVDTGCSSHAGSNDGNGQSTIRDALVAMAKSVAMATHGGGSSTKHEPLSIPSMNVTMESSSDSHPVRPSRIQPHARHHVNLLGAMEPPETKTMSGAPRPDIEPYHQTKRLFKTADDGSHEARFKQHLKIAYSNSSIPTIQGKSPSPASEHLLTVMAVSNGNTIDGVHSEDWTAIIVKQSIKTGEQVTSPVVVKLSDLSPYFHLEQECAAEELSIPIPEFKNLYKILGLIRWPSSEVRRLQKAIERLELKVAEGGQRVQVAGFINRLNFLNKCYKRLLHGTLAQMNTVLNFRAMLRKEYPLRHGEVLRSGDECQRCNGLIGIQTDVTTREECVRRADNSANATEHSIDIAPHTVSDGSDGSDGEGSQQVPVRRGREVRFDDVRVVGMQKVGKCKMVVEEGRTGCTCYVLRHGKKWYPRFEKEGPWLQHTAKSTLSL